MGNRELAELVGGLRALIDELLAVAPGTGDMHLADNLAGLPDPDAALSNLGGGTGAGGGRALFKTADLAAVKLLIGLGALAFKASVSNADWVGADLTIENGGTGASSAPAARTALGIPNFGNAAGNAPLLDASGKLLASVLPSIAVDQKFSVASQAAMLALTAEIGDIAVRTDFTPSRRFMLIDADATVLENWQRLVSPTDVVSSVADLKGDVTAAQLAMALGSFFQPADADLAAIAALVTTAFGRDVLTLADAPALLAKAGAMPRKQPIATYTASVTAVIGDQEALVRMNVASANTYTIPPNSAVAFATGTQINVRQVGAGKTTIAAGAGVTIDVTNRGIPARFGTVTLIKVAVDAWDLVGATVA